jgi:hypothetical protein
LVIILRLIGMTVAISSLTAVALQRVNVLATAELAQMAADPNLVVTVYARITVEVLSEVGLVGAIICVIALIPAVLGLGRTKHESKSAD